MAIVTMKFSNKFKFNFIFNTSLGKNKIILLPNKKYSIFSTIKYKRFILFIFFNVHRY